jgi:hypothetical protein
MDIIYPKPGARAEQINKRPPGFHPEPKNNSIKITSQGCSVSSENRLILPFLMQNHAFYKCFFCIYRQDIKQAKKIGTILAYLI